MAGDVRRRQDGPVRITTAASSRNEDISMRQRRYVLSMGIRTICFVAAIMVGEGWLRWVLVAGAVLLPYVAVVMANSSTSRSDGFSLVDAQYGRPELMSGVEPGEKPTAERH